MVCITPFIKIQLILQMDKTYKYEKKENKKLYGRICLNLYDRNKYSYFRILFTMNVFYMFMFDLPEE